MSTAVVFSVQFLWSVDVFYDKLSIYFSFVYPPTDKISMMPIVWHKKENIIGLKRTQLEKPNLSPGSKCQRIVVKDTEEVRENSRWGKKEAKFLELLVTICRSIF